MITVRISFEKKNEASYISLLDLQRVMQRVLKRSGLPVWHTLGFNPHIYMTFACPLSLGQESECECVDVKTAAAAAAVLEQYHALETAPVEKHSKRGKKIVNLKEHIPQLSYTVLGDTVQLELCLPAAQELNLNPSLLTGFLEEKFGLPAASANILRTKFLTADRQLFV